MKKVQIINILDFQKSRCQCSIKVVQKKIKIYNNINNAIKLFIMIKYIMNLK